MKKIVVASDSFKGSITNEEINEIVIDVVKKLNIDCQVVPLLIADGGDGTLDAIIKQKNGQFIYKEVSDPLFNKIKARYGIFGNSAVVSMCECSGLTLIEESKRNPCLTTTYGTGELILEAIKSGKKNIYITLGGSATNDGGIGALTALGYKFIKSDGSIVNGIGNELIDIVKIDDKDVIDFSGITFTILSDVTNTLTGAKGATKTFARQKGASDEQIEFLEKGMENFQKVLSSYANYDVGKIIGGGAAGGIGASLCSLLNAEIKSGIETILDLVNFDDIIKDADYIFTGEGKIDSQSKDGKVISGIIKRAKKQLKPVIAVVGTVGDGIDSLFDCGLTSVFSLINKPACIDEIFKNTKFLYRQTFESIIRLLYR